jgi:hypothetical protein
MEICPVSPNVLCHVMSHCAVAVTGYTHFDNSRDDFLYRCPQSGESFTPMALSYGVPAPSHRIVFPSPIDQLTTFTCAVAVTVRPGTLADLSIGPHVFSVLSTHNHTGMFTSPTCPTPGAVLTNGGARCISATA